MSTLTTYPDEKQEPVSGYADRLDSDGESSTSFNALIAEGENSIHSIQYTKSVGGSLRSMLFTSLYRSPT